VTTKEVSRLVDSFCERRPIRSTSLIISLFGDVVTQHGQVIWLGSLVSALGELGVDERLVRTSTFRLVQDGWLESHKIGRRSFYRFSQQGLREYLRVAGRIYARKLPAWDGTWTLVLPVNVPEQSRDAFRKAMNWQGFGTLSNNLYAHPGADHSGLDAALVDLGLKDRVVIMEASTEVAHSGLLINDVLWENWDLSELGERYRQFTLRYKPIEHALNKNEISDSECFRVRQLLVHEYRRVLLHDTDIPSELLPKQWPGAEARRLAADLYKRVTDGSVRYIEQHLESDKGKLPAPTSSFYQRFS